MDTLADYENWKAKQKSASVGAANVVLDSVEAQPDQVASDMNLAAEFGKTTGNPVPPLPMVAEHRSTFQQAIERQKNSTILSGAPRLAEWLRNPENAAVARDDLSNLSWFEGFGRGVTATAGRAKERLIQMGDQLMLERHAGRAANRQKTFSQLLESQGHTIQDGQGGEIERPLGPLDYAAAFARWFDARVAESNGIDDEAKTTEFAQKLSAARQRMAELPKSQIAQDFEAVAMVDGASLGETAANFASATISNPVGGFSWALETAGESGPQLLAALGASIVTRNPAVGISAMGGGSYLTERYTSPAEFLDEKGIDLNKPEDVQRLLGDPSLLDEAAKRGVIRGAIIGVFDALSGGIAGKTLANNPFVEAIAQMAQQAISGSAGEYFARVAAGQELDWNEIIAEGFAEMATAPVDAAIAGRSFVSERNKAKAAEARRTLFQALAGQAETSELRKRMPGKFRQFVAEATKDGPVENVYVPASDFVEYFQSRDIDPFALVDELDGVTRDDLDVALAGGGDLQIPTSTYAAKIAGSEHDAFLMENMRFNPDEFTAREAAEFNAKAQDALEEAWRVAEELRELEDSFRSFEQEIYDTMVSRLRAAGRSTDVATTEAMLYPAFYRVMAERSGLTTEEFMQRYPLPKVEGERPEGMQARNVDALNRTLAEARARRSVGLDKRQTLLEFISDYGGINDAGGELRARDAEVIKRGRGKKTLKLARGGMASVRDMFGGASGKRHGVDDVAQAAIEQGFMADDPVAIAYKAALAEGREVPDISAALWDAIDRELRGEAQYSVHDKVEESAEASAALDDIEDYLHRLGVSLDDSDEAIRAALAADEERQGRSYGQEDVRNLIVQHNLTAANLLHADKMRGLAVPSVAISNVDYPLDNFGDITLLGGPDLIDPRKDTASKVFDADVYSPRYPMIRYKIAKPVMNKVWKRLGDVSSELGHVLSGELDNSEVERKGLEAFRDSSAVQLEFLRSTGRNVDLPKQTARTNYLTMVPELAKMPVDTYGINHEPVVKEAIERAINLEIEKIRDAAPDLDADELRSEYYSRDGGIRRSVIDNINQEKRVMREPGVDRYAARSVIRNAVEPHADEFAAWVENQFGAVISGETIQTETARGDWKYLPHTLDNVVKVLKKKLRDGEGFNYGVGSIRSTVANQFKSVSAIQKARGRLIHADAMKAVKDEVDNEFVALAGKFAEHAGSLGKNIGWLDVFSERLKEVAERGVRVLDAYENGVPTELAQEAVAFLDKLANMPTEYFEAKLQRAVALSEFKAAVLPNDAPQSARDVLNVAGVPIFEYDPNVTGARTAMIRRAAGEGGLLFQSANDKGGRSAPVNVNGDVELHPLTLTNLKPIDTHAEARLAVELGDAVNASGDRVQIVGNSARKWFSRNANALKRSLAPHLVDAFRQSVTYHEDGTFNYAVGLINVDGQNIAVRFAIRKIDGDSNRLHQIEGVEMTPISAAPDALQGARGSSRFARVADAVAVFNRLAPGDFPLFQYMDKGPRGSVQFPASGVGNGDTIIRLFQSADLSTMLHESGHYFLTVMQDLAERGEPVASEDFQAVKAWWRSNADGVAKDAMRAASGVSVTADDVIAALENGTSGDAVKDVAIDVGMQEQWARAFEHYLMEGKAPSVELRSAFEKFRAWLISVYRHLAGLNVTVSDDLRKVFDRMLASDEEIANAQSKSGWASPVFATAEQMGLSADDYAAFMKLRAQSEDQAKARLLREIMAPIKREKEKWFRDERAKVREEVEREVNAYRSYRAMEWMGNRRWLGEGQPENLPDFRLSKDALVDRYGEGVLKTLPRGKQAIYAVEGGLDPDEAAGWFGFDSGDEMIRAIEQSPKRIDAIEAETDKVMRERHGDALNDGSLEAEALDAVHADQRGQWIAAELKAVSEVAGVNVAMSAKEARETARQTIARMRVRDAINANRFLVAERKAGEEAARLGAMVAREKVWMDSARRKIGTAARAALRGDGSVDAVVRAIDANNQKFETTTTHYTIQPHEVTGRDGKVRRVAGGERTATKLGYNDLVASLIEAKRRQLLNHALYMEARKVADEVAKAERFAAKLGKRTTREKIAGAGRRENAQIDYLAAIDEILDRYDFRKLSAKAEQRRDALNNFVEAMKAAGRENELSIPDKVLSDAARAPYKTLPVEELRGVIASLKNLEHVALRWNKLIDAENERQLDAAVEEIVGAFHDNLPKRPPGRVETRGEALRNAGRQFLNLVLNATTILREIDGFADMGAAYRNIKAPIDAAMNRLTVRKEKAARDLEALYAVYSKDERRRMAVREHIPELGYALSKWERIAVALNAGNDGNFNRLTDPKVRGSLTEEQVDAVLATLDSRDADFIQSVWDYIGSFRDDIAARERRATGVEPDWVEAVPVQIGGKMLKGGYYPIKYDPRLSALARDDAANDIAQSLQAGRFGKAQTRNGHLKERAQSSGRDIELDMSVMHRHINQVIYDLELSEAVSNSWRILQDGRVRAEFMDANKQADFDALEIWLKDVAEGELRSADLVGRTARMLKSNFTAAKLAFNLVTVAMQVTGITQSMVVVGKKNMTKGIMQTVANPVGVANDIAARSVFMASRQTTFNKDIYDFYSDPKQGPVASSWGDIKSGIVGPLSFWLMTKVQFYVVDVPTWLAGYEQGLRNFGNDEAKAIAHADSVVKRAQASGLFSDRSAVERGSVSRSARQNDVVRLFTALGSYMFAKFNVAYERTAKAGRVIGQEGVSGRSAQEAMSWTLDMVFLFTVEAVLTAAIKGRLPDDDDDDDGWAKFLAEETAFSVMATVPFVRDVAGPLQGYDGGGSYGAITKELAAPFIQGAQGEVDRALIKSIINATGLASGLPSTQINRAVDSAWRQLEGDDVSPVEYLLGRRKN